MKTQFSKIFVSGIIVTTLASIFPLRASAGTTFSMEAGASKRSSPKNKHRATTPATPSASSSSKSVAEAESKAEVESKALAVGNTDSDDLFPRSLDRIRDIRRLEGFTEVYLVEDIDSGALFVKKTGSKSDPGHIRSEYITGLAYRALGARVPLAKLYTAEGQPPIMLSQFIKGPELADFFRQVAIEHREEVKKKLRGHFVADCLLANWDVVGPHMRNIVLDENGDPYRVDNGGGLGYRALGEKKGAKFGPKVNELRTMLTGNNATRQIYAAITYQEIIHQIDDTETRKDALLKVLPSADQEIVKKRLEYLSQYRERLLKAKAEYEVEQDKKLETADQLVIFDKQFSSNHLGLNGVSLAPISEPEFTKIQDVDVNEPAFKPVKGKRPAAGVVVQELDGRIWIVEPTNHFGADHTFPKGGVEPGYSLQQTAMKEAFEEAGLQVQITGFLTDQERKSTYTRYYFAKRVGGDPAQAHWESQAIKLVPINQLPKILDQKTDQEVLKKFLEHATPSGTDKASDVSKWIPRGPRVALFAH